MNKYLKREQARLETGLNNWCDNKETVKVDINLSRKDTIIQVRGVKLSSFAKKNRVRLNENIENRFMLEAQKNTSTRKHDKKAKFLEKKRLAKV